MKPCIPLVSDPQGFLQCSKFLAAKCPDVDRVEVSDTAGAVLRLLQSPSDLQTTEAAITSRFAIELHGAYCTRDHIQDCTSNMTRFRLLSLVT
ncbi:hypothetical protein J7392_01500 [Sulfitobacter sp. R18_1]|nr:hypothetical protein [Sulfitobacter sp. R18_1]